MGFRARKSFKIAPGVRFTVSPTSASMRVGPRGAGVSVNTRGRVTQSVGIPGTGVSYVKSSAMGGSAPRTAAAPAATSSRQPTAPTPGMFAPRWEKALHRALVKDRDIAATVAVANGIPEARSIAAVFEAIQSAIPSGDFARAKQLLESVAETSFDPSTDPFITKYLPGREIVLGVAEGITANLPLDRDSLMLLLAEILQTTGDIAAAIEVVEQLENPTTVAAVSLVELYSEQGRWQDVVEMTNGLSNEDEPTAYLLIQRAVAFREQGFYESAREAFREALRVRSRSQEIRNRAYVERGITYRTEGKLAMARKDFERVLAVDSNYPGLREEIARLPER